MSGMNQSPASHRPLSSREASRRLQHLRESTLLPWPVISTLFGVSPSTLTVWRDGVPMSAGSQRLLLEFERLLITDVPAATPAERRTLLYVTDAAGSSAFERAARTRWNPKFAFHDPSPPSR